MDYIAHATPDNRTQTVIEHSVGVFNKGKSDAELISALNLYKLCSCLHDMGKNTLKSSEYQKTVGLGNKWSGGKVVHSNCGGRFIYETFIENNDNLDEFDALTAEFIATVIMSHHGLFDILKPDDDKGLNYFIEKIHNDSYDYAECKKKTLAEFLDLDTIKQIFSMAKDEIKAFESENEYQDSRMNKFSRSMFVRMVLSILINSDHADAADFAYKTDTHDEYVDSEFWKKCSDYLEEKITHFKNDTLLNKIRSEISNKAYEFSSQPAGIVRMTVPTGGGKTISSLRYAVHHAEKFNKRRIIYVAPFNSILEQNYLSIKDYLPEDVTILPHFGDWIDKKDSESESLENTLKYISEYWGAPIIATSMVQFLNSLFDGKITSLRRMRGLIDSVIIIDEVQSIPIDCLVMFNRAVDFLAKHCKCTVVLCTATQPPFEKLKEGFVLPENCEIIDEFAHYSQLMKRTQIIDKIKPRGYDSEKAADFITDLLENNDSILCVVNTKNAARSIYKEVDLKIKSFDGGSKIKLFYLSTAKCPAHRENEINELKSCLERIRNANIDNEKIICISTQLIEAGVDISFDTVVRSLSGLGNIVQAAGRCNRNGEKEMGDVYIINLDATVENISKLKSISEGKNTTETMLHMMKRTPKLYDNDLLSPKSIRLFYENYYQKFDIGKYFNVSKYLTTIYDMLSENAKGKSMVELYGGCHKTILLQAFKTAGECFEAISDNSISVLVQYGKGKELLSDLLSDKIKDYKSIFSKIGRYMIGVPRSVINHNPDYFGKESKTGIVYLVDTHYSEKFGFDKDNGTSNIFMNY